jgi:hypothetical protein
MLIKLYGEFWSPEFVNWGARGRGLRGQLKGIIRTKQGDFHIDNWGQSGVYILYDGRQIVYVGHAAKNNLGKTLRDHLAD